MRVNLGSVLLLLCACNPTSHTPLADAGPIDPDAGTSVTPPVRTMIPATSGGSIEVVDNLAIVGDSRRARVWLYDLASHATLGSIELGVADDPGRVAVDGSGGVHVVLRGAGAILDLDPAYPEAASRREVCVEPRGITWEAATDSLHVACASGELVTLPSREGAPTRRIILDDDLRDVVAADGRLYVSRFRAAELLVVDATSGVIVRRSTPPSVEESDGFQPLRFSPEVAWRLRAMPSGGVAMLHQLAVETPIEVQAAGYESPDQGGCDTGIVAPAVTVFAPDGTRRGGGRIQGRGLVMDFDRGNDGTLYLASATHNASTTVVRVAGVFSLTSDTLDRNCIEPRASDPIEAEPAFALRVLDDGSIASLRSSGLYVGAIGSASLALPLPVFVAPVGHSKFHELTLTGLACASCHPEGRDDGHVWNFLPGQARRTQWMLGGMSGHEPFHWNGDQANMERIMDTTFDNRMLGNRWEGDTQALTTWLDTQPAMRGVTRDAASVARGEAIFARADVGCASCHSGRAFTNDRNEDVGTGRDFQVPSLLGVMYRAPFMHDGCARTLEDVVAGACVSPSEGSHGHTAMLGAAERADLVAYLRSL